MEIQMYRYFVAYHFTATRSDIDQMMQALFPLTAVPGPEVSGYGCTFYLTPNPVEDDDTLQTLVDTVSAAHAKKQGAKVTGLAVITLNLVDGPTD